MTLGYKKFGIGKKTVFMTHGWMTDHSCFYPLLDCLDLKNYTFILTDQRGYGSSMNLGGPFDIKQVAKDLIQLADELNLNRFSVIGHSMGGKVIQQMMIYVPDRINAAIGITPVPACALPLPLEVLDLFNAAVSEESARLELFRLATANRYTEAWYQSMNRFSFEICKKDAFQSYFNSWVDEDISKEIDGCDVPTLVITGENDADITPELVHQTYGVWIKKTEFLTLPDCGHFPMYETPLILATKCQAFLDKCQ